MAVTKTESDFTWTGGGTTQTASDTTATLDTSADDEDTAFLKIIVGAGCTVAPSIQVQEAPAGKVPVPMPTKSWSPGTTAGTYYQPIPLDPCSGAVNLVFAAGTTSPANGNIASAQLARRTS